MNTPDSRLIADGHAVYTELCTIRDIIETAPQLDAWLSRVDHYAQWPKGRADQALTAFVDAMVGAPLPRHADIDNSPLEDVPVGRIVSRC